MNARRIARARPGRFLVALACALAVIGGASAQGSKAPPPVPGQLPPRAAGPAVEAPRVKPAAVNAEVAERGEMEVSHEPPGGAYVALRDVPAPPALLAAPSRAHLQGDDMRSSSKKGRGAALFPKAAINAPVTPPAGDIRAVGDPVRIFGGINDDDTAWFPPDTGVAAGPTHVVETANSGFSVYTKFGTPVQLGPGSVSFWDYSSFFNANLPGGWEGNLFDPRIVYDSVRERFVMLVLGKDEVNETSYAFLALSETSDPTGDWCTRRITTTDTGGTSTAWLDYAGLGVDNWGLYITGTAHYFADNSMRGSQIRSMNTDIFADCTQGLGIVKFASVTWPDGAQASTFQVADPHSVNSDAQTFLVSTWSGSGNQVLLGKLSGDRSSGATLSKVAIDIPAYDAINNYVDQPDSSTDLDGGSSKVQNAVYANRRVFFALTDDVNNDGSAAGWLTVKLNTDTNTEEWHHLLWSGRGIYYFYPALTLDGSATDANLAVFGSWTDAETLTTAATYHPSGVFKIYANQPVDTSGPLVGTPIGAGTYVLIDANSGKNRWGDYSGASYDWTCGNVWGAVESADAVNHWTTTLIARKFDDEAPCPMLEVVDPAPNVVWGSGSTQTVRWLSDDLPATDEIYVYAFLDGQVATIAEGLAPTATSVAWQVPEVPTQGALISIGSWDGSAYTAIAWSQPFDVVDATPPAPNTMRFATVPHALSTSEVAMTATLATDGSGGAVEYYFENLGGAGSTPSGWISSQSYTDAGLSPNVDYCYVVRARDEGHNSNHDSAQACAYTLAATPVPAPFSDIAGNRLTVNWDAGGNPAYTQYHVEGQPGNLDSGAITGSSWTVTGLAPGTAYTFQIKTRNEDGIETDWVELGTATTLADDPDDDGVPADLDNCTNVSNHDQRDTDGDGIGNDCDPDFDADCIVNFSDLGYLSNHFFSGDPDADLNGDGAVNFSDLFILKSLFFMPPGPAAAPNLCQP